MSDPAGAITHVSDTALMVAACRARESEAPDGFVRDPFAARLAGERGMAILAAVPQPAMMQFGIGLRSHFLDELLLETLAAQPPAAVVSLGCGLDTRPWRLDLPPALRWIEVDFPEMLDYKETRMASERPRCRRERLSADVTDAAQRRALWEAVGPEPALMITEGLLMYLPAAAVDALADEAGRETGIARWMADIITAAFEIAIGRADDRTVRHVQAADFLSGEQMLEVFRRHGWTTAAHRSYINDMAFALPRIERLLGRSRPPERPVASEDPTGIHLFARSG